MRRSRPLALALPLALSVGAGAAGCGSRAAPDDPPAPLSTGIPVGAPGATGVGFDAPALAAPASTPRRTSPKRDPRPLPPDPFDLPDPDGAPPPTVSQPPKPKGVPL